MALIELLVALVIASLGLLTLAALQAAALRYTQVSQRRALITLMVQDFTERLRANATGAEALSDYVVALSFSEQGRSDPAPPASLCNTAQATCTRKDMAAADLYEWRKRVREMLPEGAVFTRHVSAESALDVWVAWRDPVQHDAPDSPVRPAGECPAGLALDATADATVRCLRWRVRR